MKENMVEYGKYNIPEPVLFNCMKHHAGYISNYISGFDLFRGKTKTLLKQEIKVIGNSQIDLYTGNLSPFNIANQIIDFLKVNKADTESSWLYWLEQADTRYRTISISDGSTWILLPGKKKDRYVHIHPGRSSPHTVRVRSETLKCAIASLVFARHHKRNAEDPDFVNLVRMEVLNLSPVRDIDPNRGIGKLIKLLNENQYFHKSR